MTQTAPPVPEPTAEPTRGARRYPRTFGGLIGSMVVLVLAVGGYWALQNLTHDHPDVHPEAIAYQETVGAAQQGGYTLVYPSALSKGWKATSVRFVPGDRPVWGLGVLTKAGTYAGVEQEDADLDTLLTTYVDKAARQGEDVTLDSPLASTWSSWSDAGGDHAFAATVDVKGAKQTVLVYGSASVSDLKQLVESLVTAPVTPAS